MIEAWDPERIDELVALTAAALPHESLSADELQACCWDDPGVVLGDADGTGAVAAVTRRIGSTSLAWIRLLVVHPSARRRGLGRELLTAGEAWCRSQGASQVRFGASAPFYLWPGIDVAWSAGLCLAEAAGYRPEGAELNLSCPTTFRAPEPPGVAVTRVVDDRDASDVTAWCAAHWPQWVPELERGIDQGGAFVARSSGAVAGFACHSVNRAAWIGPMATRDRHGGHVPGTGSALLGHLCRDLMVAGYPDAQIAWVGPVSFYVKAAGAAVARVFRTVVKDLDRSAT